MHILDNSSAQNTFIKMASGTSKNRSKENQENIKHILENLLDCGPEDNEDSSFMKFFQ